jgi:hypothetical protein
MDVCRFHRAVPAAAAIVLAAGFPVLAGGGDTPAGLAVPQADSARVRILETRDGTVIGGRIVASGPDTVRIETPYGPLSVPAAMVRAVRDASMRKGSAWPANPNATRLFFMPTGRMLKAGESYFADYYVFFPTVTHGFTDRFTLGGGMSLIPGAGLKDQIYYVTPKVGVVSSPKFSLAAGALLAKFPDFGDDEPDSDDIEAPLLGVLYGVGTFGGEDANVTLGLGYGFVDGAFAEKPLVTLGGEKRLSRRTALVTENWIIPGADDPVVSYGLRMFGERLCLDVAFLHPLGEDFMFPGIPYVDFVVFF